MNEIQEKSKNSDVDGFDVVVDCSGHPAALKQVDAYSIQTVKEAHVAPLLPHCLSGSKRNIKGRG
jgi:hypothetical protein